MSSWELRQAFVKEEAFELHLKNERGFSRWEARGGRAVGLGKAGAKVQRQEMKALAPEQPGASRELVVWCGSPEDRKGH